MTIHTRGCAKTPKISLLVAIAATGVIVSVTAGRTRYTAQSVFFLMNRAEQVRQILLTRNLTLYSVSHRSREIFGPLSQFHIPHNLYYDLADGSSVPNLYQLVALSRITNYRLCDWLTFFGVGLELIPRLGLSIPRKRTALLDSTVYDTQAWIPWFTVHSLQTRTPAIAPLRQILTPTAPTRAADFLAASKRAFLYGKVGDEDSNAFPYFAPGTIVRIGTRNSEELLSTNGKGLQTPFFFVECAAGWTCSQIAFLGKGRLTLYSPLRPSWAQTELQLDKDARILGLVDAEIRPVITEHELSPPCLSMAAPVPRALPPEARPGRLGDLLRTSHLRMGLAFREASEITRRFADMLSDEHFFIAASTLSDYETLSGPPHTIHKSISLCALYEINFFRFLQAAGIPVEQSGSEPMPDELVARPVSPSIDSQPRSVTEQNGSAAQDWLSCVLHEWEELPIFLRHSLSALTGVRNVSLSDVFWVGADKNPMHPWLINATLVAVNRRIKKPKPSRAGEPRLSMIFKRDGTYLCACCAIDEGDLLVYSYRHGSRELQRMRNGIDAEIIGQVTAIMRRFS